MGLGQSEAQSAGLGCNRRLDRRNLNRTPSHQHKSHSEREDLGVCREEEVGLKQKRSKTTSRNFFVLVGNETLGMGVWRANFCFKSRPYVRSNGCY